MSQSEFRERVSNRPANVQVLGGLQEIRDDDGGIVEVETISPSIPESAPRDARWDSLVQDLRSTWVLGGISHAPRETGTLRAIGNMIAARIDAILSMQ